jgi:hypothetical protein
MIMPGVQMPHWAAPCARKACAQAVDPVRPGGLDRGDVAAVGLRRRHEAGAGLRAVDQHGAGAAIAGVAADLGAGEAEALAQRVGERWRRRAPSRCASRR